MTAVAPPRSVVRHAPASEWHGLVAVVRRALRDQRRSPLTWGLPLGLMSALEVAIWPSVQDSIGKAIESYPEALKKAFRIETMDTPAQFLNGEMFSLIIPLAIAFFAIRAATRPVVGYEERHWLDIVMAAPLRRRTLVAGAFIASAISSAVILFVTAAQIWLAGQIFGAVIGAGPLATAMAETWAFTLFFIGVALLAAGRLGSWTTVTAFSAGLLVAMYVLDFTSRVADALHDFGPLSAFHWYGTPLTDGFDAGHLGLALVGILLAAGGALLFERRDIHG